MTVRAGFAAQEQVDEQLARFIGPRVRERRRGTGQTVERASFDARVVTSGGRRYAQRREPVVRHVDLGSQLDHTIAQHDPRAQVAVSRDAALERSGQRRVDAHPHLVAGPGNSASGGRDVAHELVGIVVAECVGHRRLFLEHEAVAWSPGSTVQLDTRAEDHRVRLGQVGVVAFEHDRSGRLGPAHGVNVP